MPTCRRHYPGRFNGACSLVDLPCQRPSPCNSKVGSCHCFFGACSAFTHVTACSSRSRLATLYTESSDSFVASAAVSIASGWSEPVPGREFHPLESSAFHGALLRQLRRVGSVRGRSRDPQLMPTGLKHSGADDALLAHRLFPLFCHFAGDSSEELPRKAQGPTQEQPKCAAHSVIGRFRS